MAPKAKITLDHKGIGEILRSGAVHAALRPLATGIASSVRSQRRADVVVDTYTTSGMRSNRVAMSVTVRDPRAMLWQARDGLLTRAAAATGLEVRSR